MPGGGYVNLEDLSSLLHVKDNNRNLQSDVMEVYNKLSGAGTVWIDFAGNDQEGNKQGGGIHFNVDSDDQFSGWVVLQDAYTEVRGEDTPIFHNKEAHLLVAENGVLKVFGTEENSPSTTHVSNLSIGFSYQDGLFDKGLMHGTNVASGSESLLEFHVNPSDNVHDYLIVDNLQVGKAQITIDTSEWGDEFVKGNSSLLTADEGENKTLIRVTGGGKDEPGDLEVITPDQKQMIKVGNIDVAEATWSFDEKLTKVSDNQDGADWAIAYSLSQVDLRDASGEGLVLSVADDATSDADRDFTATITGSGKLTIQGDPDGENDTITLGKKGNSGTENSYTGKTFVTDGATVIFQADKAMGKTSSLELENGTTVDLAGFEQKVLNLSGTGTLVVDDGASFTLDKSQESGTITVNASLDRGAGASQDGTFIVKSSGGSLVFGSSNAFDGLVRLENTSTTLTGNTASVLSDSILHLYSGSALHLGSAGGTLAGIGSDDSGDIVFDGFHLGATGGTALDLGGGTSSGKFEITLPGQNGFAIADGNLLIESDNPGNTQVIIDGDVTGSDFVLSGADSSGKLNQSGVGFFQGGDRVADTDWIVSLVDNGASGLGLQYELTHINLRATGDKYLVIDTDASGSGQDLVLDARVTGNGNIAFNAKDGQAIVFQSKPGEANNYTGATFVQNGTLSLESNDVLGDTSVLNVSGGASVLLNNTTQLVHDLAGTGGIDLGSGTLNLTKTAQDDLAVGNAISGNGGTLAINLLGGELTFANDSSYDWQGKLELTNTLLKLNGFAEGTLDAVNVIAHAGTKITVDSQDKLGSLTLNGSELEFGGIVLGGSGSTILDIANGLDGSGSASFSGGLTVSDSLNLLDADDGDLSQIVISAGQILDGTTIASAIQGLSGVSVQSGAASTEWTLSNLVQDGNNFVIKYQLTKIDLQPDRTLNLAQSEQGDGVLSAWVTGDGAISFDGGNITISNAKNDYTGATLVTSGSLTLGADGALGGTSELNLATGTSFNLNGFDQTVHALTGVGTVAFGTTDSVLTVSPTTPRSATSIDNIFTGTSGTLKFENAGDLTFTNGANLANSFIGTINLAGTSVDLTNSSITTAKVFAGTNLVLGNNGSAVFGNGVGTSGQMTLKGLDLSSDAAISFDGVDLTNNGGAAVNVGNLTGTTGFNVDIDLTADIAMDNVLVDDDGYQRDLIQASGVDRGLSGYSGGFGETTSAIRNGADGPTVAYGVWSGGWSIGSSGLSVSAGLSEVQLADATGSGLVLDATGSTGSGAELSAKITDWTNADGVLTVAGTGPVMISNDKNDYHGQTNVLGGATLIVTGTLGNTSLLDNEGSVQIGDASTNTMVNVGDLAGSGSLSIVGSSTFRVVTDEDLSVDNALSFGTDGTFAVSGSGSRIDLSFTKNNDKAAGVLDFTNVNIEFADSSDSGVFNKSTILSSNELRLTNSLMTISRANANNANERLQGLYADNTTLRFTDIELAASGTTNGSLLYVDTLSIAQGSGLTLDISAELTGNSNLLQLDNSPYEQNLIHYNNTTNSEEDLKNLIHTSNAVAGGLTEYEEGGELKAYVTWGGGEVLVKEDANIVAATYKMTGIQLADTSGDGLVLEAAENTQDHDDYVLSAIVSDYTDEETGEVIAAGNITFNGNLFIGTGVGNEDGNSYTGKTFVRGGSLTVNKSDAFGRSSHVEVESTGKVVFASGSQGSYSQALGSLATYAAEALSGNINLTLGIYGEQNGLSSVVGANENLGGKLTLNSGHAITLTDSNGLGSMEVAGVALTDPEGEFVSNASLRVTSGSGSFDNHLTGALDVDLTTATGGMNWSGSNSFTGSTTIRGAGVTLLNDGVLGTADSHTSVLDIVDGATVNFGVTTQYAGEINAEGNEAIAGAGTITLDRGGLIGGANAGFSGTVVVREETLEINNAESLGTGQANLSGDAVLNIEGVSGTDGGYAVIDNVITGSGSVSVSSDSVVQLDVNNSFTNSFTGGIDIAGDLLATGNVRAHIGSGEVKIETDGKAVFAGSSGWTLKNKLTGTGELEVSAGGDEFAFGFGDTNAGDFTGSIALSQGSLTLSGNDTVNANTVAGADLTLGDNSILNVTTGYTGQDNHVNVLNAGATSQIVFNGLNPWDSNYGGMTVGQLNVTAGSTIVIDSLKTSSGGSITSDQVIIADNDGLLSTLIASSGISGAFVLGGAANGVVTHTVDVDSVAKATYEFSLSQDADGVDLNYQLTQVDVSGGQQLALRGEVGDSGASDPNSTLSALVTGGGGLNIAGNSVRLSNGNNDYLGATTVATAATLFAESGALGQTSLLDVLGTAWVDDNAVDVLDVQEGGVLNLTGNLEIGNRDVQSNIDGHIEGSGALSLAAGVDLSVTDANARYSGVVSIGSSGTITLLGNSAGLGIGAISFSDGAVLNIQFTGDKTLTNTVTSTGNAGLINVSGNGTTSDFAFANGQTVGFDGTLSLQNVTYDFNTAGNDKLDKAALTVGTGVQVVIAQGDDSNKLDGLALSGGLIDFGAATGHIQLGGGNMTVDANSEFQIDHDDIDVIENDNGGAAFGSGSSSIILVSDVGNAAALTQDDLGKITVKLDGNNTQFNRKIKQRGKDVAALKGGLGALDYVDDDLTIGLENTELELLVHDGSGYVISQSGGIAYQMTGSGDITIDSEVTFNNTNTYTGDTYVTSFGTLTLTQNNALGGSGGIYGNLVVNGGHVIFSGTATETVDNLKVSGDGALSGNVALNVEFSDNASGYVYGKNGDLMGSINLSGQGTLEITDEDALGTTDVTVGQSTTLELSGVGAQGTAIFENDLSGAGVIALNGSNIRVTGDNDSLAAAWNVLENSALHVNTEGERSVQDRLGTGAINLSGNAEFVDTTGWTLANELTGKGTLKIEAGGVANTFTFGQGNSDFTGTLQLNAASIDLRVDDFNETTLKGATLQLDQSAQAVVHSGDRAIDLSNSSNAGALVLNGGNLIFEGSAGVNVGTKTLGQLVVDKLDLSSGGSVTVNIDQTQTVGAQNASDILAADTAQIEQWLIRADYDRITGVADGESLTLISNADFVTATIMDENGPVAQGKYEYTLEVESGNATGSNGLGLAFKLTEVTIQDEKELVLNGSGKTDTTLEAAVHGSASGTLAIAGTAEVTLTEENGYSGKTDIRDYATLIAYEKALGYSQLVAVGGNAKLVNSGSNEIGALDADGKVELIGSLTILGTSDSELNGTLTGDGNLTIADGTFNVSSANGAYSGAVTLGSGASGATLSLDEDASLGAGSISFANDDSVINVTVGADGKTLTNTISSDDGVGGTINVSGQGGAFTFAAGQGQSTFKGDLYLTNVAYNFGSSGNNHLASATMHVNGGAQINIIDAAGAENNLLGGLALNGGGIDFGTAAGQINLQNAGSLTLAQAGTTFEVDSNLSAIENDTGSAAFGSNESVTLIAGIANAGSLTNDALNSAITVSGDGTSISRDIQQKNFTDKDAKTVATLSGGFADEALQFSGSNLNLNLDFETLTLQADDGIGYRIDKSGTISYKIDGKGDLTISNDVTLEATNAYAGDTYVESDGTLRLAAQNALGSGGDLNVAQSGTVFFGANQLVTTLNSAGSLQSAQGAAGTLTITSGGVVSGPNEQFHMAVRLEGGADLTVNHAASLGDGAIEIVKAGTNLVFNGVTASGRFTNALNGSGGLAFMDGANIELAGDNKLTGGMHVESGAHVSAAGDVKSHLGTGPIVLDRDGIAGFELTEAGQATDGVWTWSNSVTGAGQLTVALGEAISDAEELQFSTDSLSGFGGELVADNWYLTLDASATADGDTLVELNKMADAAKLTLTDGASADVAGAVNLGNKDFELRNGGQLVFNGVSVPGSTDASISSSVSAGDITLGSGFVLSLDTNSQMVDAGTLLTQDDAAANSFTLMTGQSAIQGDLTQGRVEVVGQESGTDLVFDIQQGGNVPVAEGHYGYTLEKAGDNQTELRLSYELKSINLLTTLTLTGSGSNADDEDNELKVQVTGGGNLVIGANAGTTSGYDVVRLSADNSSYSGSTTVQAHARLYAEAGALGNTSALDVKAGGRTDVLGDNVVKSLNVESDGILLIGNDTVSEPAPDDQKVVLAINAGESASGSTFDGSLYGDGIIRVSGHNTGDDEYDLKLRTGGGIFVGSLELLGGASSLVTTTHSYALGNADGRSKVVVDEKSSLFIESTNSNELTLGSRLSGSGLVSISLAEETGLLHFSRNQSAGDDAFAGTIELQRGTIDFDALTGGTEHANVDILKKATLQLDQDANLVLGSDFVITEGNGNDRLLAGLTLAGGTIDAGPIGYALDSSGLEGSRSTTHVNLQGGTLTLTSGAGSTMVFGTSDDAVEITDTGTEVLLASQGVDMAVIHDIGSLVDENGKAIVLDENDQIDSSYLKADVAAGSGQQRLSQTVTGATDKQVVAEVTRVFDDGLTYREHQDNPDRHALMIGYHVSEIGLLYAGNDEDAWAGLTVTASTDANSNVLEALIRDGRNGTQGNIVFKGAQDADGNAMQMTVTGGNTYHGRTLVTSSAKLLVDGDDAFGNTSAIRIDEDSSINFGEFDQTAVSFYAYGDGALKSTADSQLTVRGDAVFTGANAELAANWTFEGNVEIRDEESLGTGAVNLGATGALLITGTGVDGDMTNAVSGTQTSSMTVASGADVSFTTADTLGGSFAGSLTVYGSSTASFGFTGAAEIANTVEVANDSTLKLNSQSGGVLQFTGDAAIAGTLEIFDLDFDLSADQDVFENGSTLAVESGALISVSGHVENHLSNLTLGDGSTVSFETGTPGIDDATQIVLSDSAQDRDGKFSVSGSVNVVLNLEDYVNANPDIGDDVQSALKDRPLTAQDALNETVGVISQLITAEAGDEDNQSASFNLIVSGGNVGLDHNQLTIDIRNNADDEEAVAKGIYGYTVDVSDDNASLNLVYGLREVQLAGTLALRGYEDGESDNVLSAAVTGVGGLQIADGVITLSNNQNMYSGATSVDAGAVLIAGDAGHTLGNTSKLELAAYQRQSDFDEGYGGRVAIYGAETVGALEVGENAVLYLVDNDAHNGSLTIRGTETSEINGTLSGAGSLTVEAESAGATLSVNTANTGFTGDVTIGNGAAVRIAEFNSLGVAETAGTIQIDQGGRLEVEAEVDATSSASRVTGTLANTVTGSGTVVVNVTTSGDSNDPARFSFADSQTGGPDVSSDTPVFDGTIRLEQGGFTLAFATDESLELTANQKAAWNAEISVGENGHLYVSQRDHENARFVDKHIRALTLDGGNIYFGGLRYDMQSLEDQLGGQLELAGDLNINAVSYVNLDAGTTNLLSDSGSELLFADTGAKIDLIQHAADILVSGGSVINNLGKLNEHLKLNISDEDAWQTISQKGEEVARVLRTFGQGEENNVFGIESSSGGSGYDLYLNYHVSEIELINPDQGLVITNNDLENAESLTAKLSGSGKITLAGGTILLGDGSEEGNVNTGEVIVTGTVVAGNYNAFGNGSTLTVNSGTADFGDYSQVLESLYSTGTLIGSSSGTITIKGEMEIEGSNNEFSSNIIFDTETATSGTAHDVDALGGGKITISDNYTLVVDDTEGGKLDNVIEGSGVLVVGTDESKPTSGSIELSGNNKGFTGDINVKDGWMLTAEMDADETAADHIGTGSLELDSGSNAGFTQTGGGLNWNSTVTGEGNLILTADANQSIRVSGGLENFSGSVTVSGGRFDLGDGNEAALHETDLVAAGGNTTITVLDTDDQVRVEGDFAVTDDADIVFNTPATPGTISDASLKVHGKLDLTGADVTVHVDDSLTPGTPGTDSLTVQDILSEDRSSSLSLVIAEADGGIGNYTGDLTILNSNGETVDLGSKGIAINDAEGNRIATGYYSYGLNVTEDNPNQLGVSYQLTKVNVSGAAVLALEGATAGSPEYENALTLSANVTGEGGLQLTSGDLTLAGNANNYEGPTIVGTESGSAATLTVSSGSSLGRTDALFVYGNAVFVNESKDTEAGRLVVDENGTVQLDAGSVLTVTDSDSQSVLDGTLTGSGALNLNDGVSLTVSADKAQSYTGLVTVGDGATYDLQASSDAFVTVAHSFASDENTTARVGFDGSFELEEANSNYHGSFVLSDGTVIRTDLIDAFGASEARIETAENASATVRLTYSGEDVGNVKQSMSSGITFEKAGTGVVAMSDSAMGAGAVSVTAGGLTFGTAGSDDSYSTDLTVSANAWAAGFGGVDSLEVESNGAFFVGGRNGYNSILDGEVSTVTFNVAGNLTNNGTIYVGNQTAEGETPLESGSIGNELVIGGDYVTSGGTLVMNAILAGDANSKADHVTITGGIKGQGYIDVNYNTTTSTGGTLKYLGLVSVGEAENPNDLSLKLKDEVKIGDLWYALMYSTEKKEYYLESSETDPGTDPWDPNEREDVTGATIASLAFMQGQTFDLSLHDHIGETTYIDPITGEVRRTSFWMIQKGDWTRFSNDSGQVDTDGHTYTTHLGGDFYSNRMDTVTHRFGVLASFADGSYDMQSGVTGKATKASFRGYSAGLYWAMTPETESGPFAGLQLRWNKFDNELSGEASHDYDVSGISITAEAGWDQLMSRGVTDSGRTYEWRVEPHVRAYWTNFGDMDSWSSGQDSFKAENDNGLLVRVGARTKYTLYSGEKGKTPAVQTYAEANWAFNNAEYSVSTTNPYTTVESSQSGTNFAEFRLGVEAQFNKNVNVWLEGHHQTGSDDYESTGAMAGFKYLW